MNGTKDGFLREDDPRAQPFSPQTEGSFVYKTVFQEFCLIYAKSFNMQFIGAHFP